MVEISVSGLGHGDYEIDIVVSGPDEDADKILVDLQDRALKLTEALEDDIHPDDADGYIATVDWDSVIDEGGDA
ncbi:hypothetical protein J2752_000493 [Halarchaeum rubridurum]|uniref:Uncharacterized protein n=1 Tax=Halarchaeum rubridurum TaxID=489911 RepID=A0A830FXZ4_9EURY|nr:hypothetical protein [Halarchaeum rubridurum]MBP1953612.1 hypothetical protein [Halarchaeum rubridurum]GGM63923.1 hypothetical protein GCM10009017_12510 [Halarchaeum rubridurum]